MTNPKHTSSDLAAEIRKEAAIQIGFDGPAYQTLTRWADRIEALEAENERLRAALEKIAGLGRWETMTEGCNAATDAVSIARAALEARHD